MSAPAIAAAAAAVANDLWEAFADNAERFSCSEIETLAGLYVALGDPDAARNLIEAHATDDEEGDAHYTAA